MELDWVLRGWIRRQGGSQGDAGETAESASTKGDTAGQGTGKAGGAKPSGTLKTLWNRLFPRPTRKFGAWDYEFRLAEVTIAFMEYRSAAEKRPERDRTEAEREEADRRAAEREKIEKLLTGIWDPAAPPDAQTLAARFEGKSRLQSELCYLVNYTPSRWLVEREISTIREVRKAQGRPIPEEPNPPPPAGPGAPGPADRLPVSPTQSSPPPDATWENPYEWMYQNSATGLCFSGGGIRSATFNLGVLQALAYLKDSSGTPLLERFDYLSSVSGGGYIHEWLAAWIKRRSLTEVREKLIPLPEKDSPAFHPEPLKWLRRYSNYLTPRKGLLSADTWVAVAIWGRNTFLNQLVLVSLLLFALLVPHMLVAPLPAPAEEVPGSGSTAGMYASPVSGWRDPCAPATKPEVGRLAGLLGGTLAAALPPGRARGAIRPSHEVHPAWLNDLFAWLDTLVTSCREKSVEWSHSAGVLGLLAILLYVVGVATLVRCLRVAARAREDAGDASQKSSWQLGGGARAAFFIVGCLLFAALFVSRLIVELRDWDSYEAATVYWVVFILLYLANAGLAWAGGTVTAFKKLCGVEEPEKGGRGPEKVRPERQILWRIRAYPVFMGLFTVLAAAAATGLFALLRWILCCGLPAWIPGCAYRNDPWQLAIVIGPPMFQSVYFLSQVLLAGLIGRDFEDWLREWLASIRAWSLMIGGAWFLWFGVSLFGSPLVGLLARVPWTGTNTKWYVIATWILTTGGSVLAGHSSRVTGGAKEADKTAALLNALAIVGPYVFVAGLLLLIAWTAEAALAMNRPEWRFVVYLAPLFVFYLFGQRVDINEFSMHPFYRNRLSRCYLGATNPDRQANPLTGFDEKDTNDTVLSEFLPPPRSQDKGYAGPFPIFCATLNLTFGEDLAWQERKAASFAFTPLYSGYHVGWTAGRKGQKLSFNGYVPTNRYASPPIKRAIPTPTAIYAAPSRKPTPGGINMATAAALSGAAFSPNWGYHTNPATAFLMTTFNARLGWWLRNPRRSKIAGWGDPETAKYDERERPSPRFAAFQLIQELFGAVNDTREFVYLTDGGHFDNMGLYELVRRRCRYIVVCDAEEDADYHFGGIATAIRLCRVDFGVDIELDLAPLRPQMDAQLGYAVSKQHFVLGKIRYPEQASKKDGVVLYIKSSLTGEKPVYGRITGLPAEPGDIVNHKLCHGAFPHDTTVNQWFDEQTFESYRHLGLHILDEIDECKIWSQVLP